MAKIRLSIDHQEGEKIKVRKNVNVIKCKNQQKTPNPWLDGKHNIMDKHKHRTNR